MQGKRTKEHQTLVYVIEIGFISILIYLINYCLRNMLSVNTPAMLKEHIFSSGFIGVLSSVYMVVYAIGQLINGFLGDRVSPKWLAASGLGIAGIVMVAFPATDIKFLQILYFAGLGFGLSMIRGPIMKIITENTEPEYARIICALFSSTSFLGTFIASLFAIIFKWKSAFICAGIIAIVTLIVAVLVVTKLEKNGAISYSVTKSNDFRSMFSVFKIEKFGFYLIIGAIVEIFATAINFWIPTYFTDYLAFSIDKANIIFSIISISKAVMPIFTLVIYKLIKGRDNLLLLMSFVIAFVSFLLLIFLRNPIINVIFLLIGKMATGISSAVLWSIYLPGLGKTGRVSSINGVLDCSGYLAASAANLIFANLLNNASWSVIILVWTTVPLVGFIFALAVQMRKTSTCANGGL